MVWSIITLGVSVLALAVSLFFYFKIKKVVDFLIAWNESLQHQVDNELVCKCPPPKVVPGGVAKLVGILNDIQSEQSRAMMDRLFQATPIPPQPPSPSFKQPDEQVLMQEQLATIMRIMNKLQSEE